MARQIINIGAVPGDQNADTLRVGMDKVTQNFTELYEGAGLYVQVVHLGQIATQNTTDWHSMPFNYGTQYFNNKVIYGANADTSPIVDMPSVFVAPFDCKIKSVIINAFEYTTADYVFKMTKYNRDLLNNLEVLMPNYSYHTVTDHFMFEEITVANTGLNDVTFLKGEVAPFIWKCSTAANKYIQDMKCIIIYEKI